MPHIIRFTAALGAFALTALPTTADAQDTSTQSTAGRVTVVPGARYQAGSMTRAILGSGWRDVWATPVSAPVLDLETYAGGLKFKERGGGFHSLVLHLQEEDGWKEYRFRSVEKFPKLPPTFQGTLAGKIWQDQVSILFPGAPLLVPPILKSIGALHVTPELYVMEDSPRLGVQRDSVKGMLGTMELKGQEAPDDKPGFAGSTKIQGTEKFMESIAESRENRLALRTRQAARSARPSLEASSSRRRASLAAFPSPA